MSAPRDVTFSAGGRKYRAVLTPDLEAGGFTVEVPELPGVVTEAETVSEARHMACDASTAWLEATRFEGVRKTRR